MKRKCLTNLFVMMFLTSQRDCTFCQTLILVPLCLLSKETSPSVGPGSIIFISHYFWSLWQDPILLLAHNCTPSLLHASLALNNTASVPCRGRANLFTAAQHCQALHSTDTKDTSAHGAAESEGAVQVKGSSPSPLRLC